MPENQTGKGRGCFFYGCLSVVVLGLVCVTAGYFGLRYWINSNIEQYTVTSPMPIEKVDATPEEARRVEDRFKSFVDAIRSDQAVDTLVLSAKDLNLLLSAPSVAPVLKDHIQVAISGQNLKAKLSLPLEQFPPTELLSSLGLARIKGRYLNGSAEVKASLENGVLFVTLDALEVNGKPVPEEVMARIRSQNLAKDVYKDARSVEVLKKLDSIQVQDGRVLIKPRGQAP